jgi:hypothetical protein
MFKELKAEWKQLPSQCFCKEIKQTKNAKTLFLGEQSIKGGYLLFAGDFGTQTRR